MKKATALILSMLLVIGLLAGCQTAGGSTEQTQGGEPLGTPDNPVVVTYLCKDLSPADQDVIDFCAKLEENMAAQGMYIRLEVLEAPAGNYAEVVPLAVRTGQITHDIIYFQGGDLPVAQEGLLEDLTPYVESSTYVKDLMMGFTAERIANYPYLLYLADISVPAPVIRSDIFTKLESGAALMEDPSIDNYYAMFKEIVEGGHAKYVITTDGGINRLDSIFNQAFGVTSTIMKVDGKYVYGKTTEFEKAKLEFYAKLYAEGLIDPEYITKGWEAMEQAFYTGEVAMLAGTAGAVIDVYNTKIIEAQGEEAILTALPPASGVGQSFTAIDVSKEGRGRAIHADSQVKEAAWAVLDYMASPEGRLLDLRGVEGVHYNIEDGQIVTTERFGGWWSRFYGTTYKFDPVPPLAAPVMSQPALDTLDLAQEYAVNDINVVIPEELTANWDAMSAIYADYSTDIIRGIRPIDDFDQMVADWNAAGGDAFAEYLAGVLE